MWALGCLLYELMTLKKPFEACSLPALVMKIMKVDFEPAPDIYSTELESLLNSMLNQDPCQRPTAAQIMCNPVMIKTIFKLYMEVGSISYTKRREGSIESSLSKMNLSGVKTPPSILNKSLSPLKSKATIVERRMCCCIWYFESKSQSIILLPLPSKGYIKSVALGFDCKIGATDDGHVVRWDLLTEISYDKCSSCQERDKFIAFTPILYDEKIAINIVSVVCGNDFVVCLSGKGVIFTCGKPSSGCLGFSSKKEIHQPQIVEALFGHHIISIACGPRHVVAISDENGVFSWGHGSSGCLGLGEKQFQVFPKIAQIAFEEKPEKVFCGFDTSFIITQDSCLLACGSNRHNKLAVDTGENHSIDEMRIFTRVHSHPFATTNVVSVGAGKSHTVFLNGLGEVYTVGSNRFCQLGWGDKGLDYTMPQKVEKLQNLQVSQVACGDFFTLAVTDENYLYCWGQCPASLTGRQDLLFDVERPSSFKKKFVQTISCGSEECIIIGEDRE